MSEVACEEGEFVGVDEDEEGLEDEVEEWGDKQAELREDRLAKYEDEEAEQEGDAQDDLQVTSFPLERSRVGASIWLRKEAGIFTTLGSTSQVGE